MITLAQIRALKETSDAFEQNLWYEESVDGHKAVGIFPQTQAYLAARVREGKLLYAYATHAVPGEEEELDFFLSASTVETLGAILVALALHRKLYVKPYWELPRFNSRQEWFIAPALPPQLY